MKDELLGALQMAADLMEDDFSGSLQAIADLIEDALLQHTSAAVAAACACRAAHQRGCALHRCDCGSGCSTSALLAAFRQVRALHQHLLRQRLGSELPLNESMRLRLRLRSGLPLNEFMSHIAVTALQVARQQVRALLRQLRR